MTKDCTTCKYGFVDEQLGFPMCHHPKRFSEDCVDFNMYEKIEEPEKATGIKLPDGLEEVAEDRVTENGRFPISEFEEMRIKDIKFGAEWMKAKMMEGAVEGRVYRINGNNVIENLIIPQKFQDGDKVKVIVIKEDE